MAWLATNKAAVAIAAEVACGNSDSNSTGLKLSEQLPAWEESGTELLQFTPSSVSRLVRMLIKVTEVRHGEHLHQMKETGRLGQD